MGPRFLGIKFDKLENKNVTDTLIYRNRPFINSEVFVTTIENAKLLTSGEDVKTAYQFNLSRKDISYNFLPGDAIAIFPKNSENEVKELLLRLDYQEKSLQNYKLVILKNTTKKNSTIPKHIPVEGTLYNTFINNIDIRTPPKKLFLKQLIQYTTNPNEIELLEKICSPSGSGEYLKLLANHISLLNLFKAFPSCMPPIELILEFSAPLQPRYFSIASSPLDENIISIIFYVIQHENGLKGICTGWLENAFVTNQLEQTQVPFYFRKPSDFHFDSLSSPNILIATGTGIAPFFGFLRHKKLSNNENIGKIFLFYGCRYENRDFLNKDEINNYVQDGTLEKVYTAFSRESDQKFYIQNRIIEHGTEIVDLLLNENATMYVCGDAKTTVKNIKETIIQCLIKHKNIEQTQAIDILTELIKDKKYLVDSWM